jgi:hypothetical protein
MTTDPAPPEEDAAPLLEDAPALESERAVEVTSSTEPCRRKLWSVAGRRARRRGHVVDRALP